MLGRNGMATRDRALIDVPVTRRAAQFTKGGGLESALLPIAVCVHWVWRPARAPSVAWNLHFTGSSLPRPEAQSNILEGHRRP